MSLTSNLSNLGFNTGSRQASAHKFPDDLDGFGYHVTDDGELRQKANGERFVFEVKTGDRGYNQAHYEALGDAVARQIEGMLEQRGLDRILIPTGVAQNQPHSYIFTTKNFLEDTRRVMVLVPGSAIRVGQWARKIVMNDSVYRGSVLEYVDRAISENYSLLVLNTNQNSWKNSSGIDVPIPQNSSPGQHLAYIWDNFIA
ncbi:hypothetical protein HDU93_008674 [Gonapodya sp. JEL0774]|nr:hypothetical protein HDU93_008674 [Gonapodya sp. JEL0774]